MAISKASLLSLGASGKVAKTIVASKWKGKKVVRAYAKPGNPQTVVQQAQRSTFGDAVFSYRTYLTSQTIRDAWNVRAKTLRKTMSGYNNCIGALKDVLASDPDASFASGLEVDNGLYGDSLLHYKLNDDDPNTLVADSSILATDGALIGGNTEDLSASGKIGKAFRFFNDTHSIQINPTILGIDGSVCCWFNAASWYDIWFGLSSDSAVEISAYNANWFFVSLDGILYDWYYFPAMAFGTWYWFCLVRSAGTTRVYLDNIESVSGGYARPAVALFDRIDRLAPDGPYRWRGLFDDVRMYDVALTSDQRTAIFNAAAGTENIFNPPDHAFTMNNMDDGLTGDEAGNFEIWVGKTSRTMLLVGSAPIVLGAIDFSTYVVDTSIMYIELRKDGVSRSGILSVPR